MKTWRFNPASFTHPGSPGPTWWSNCMGARVEEIKASGSTACRSPARLPCWSKFQGKLTTSGVHNLGFALKMVGKNSLRNMFKLKVMNDCLHKLKRMLFSSPMTFRYFRSFLRPGTIAKIL